MKKILNIAWKDLISTFRDPAALVLMLVTPFALTLAIAFAFGRLTDGGSGGSGLADIPVLVVNHDPGQFGTALVQVLESDDLADLLEPRQMSDESVARVLVDTDKAAVVVIIPPDLSARILPTAVIEADYASAVRPSNQPRAVIEVYANPTRPISAGVVRGIIDQFLGRVAAGAVGGQVSVAQLVINGLISPQEAEQLGQQVAQRAGELAASRRLIVIKDETAEGGSDEFDWLAFMAPSMAILFLMFTTTSGGRTILSERRQGTLPRMLVSPTRASQVLGGKVAGVYVTGLAQMLILIGASALLFGVRWGDTKAVLLITLALVAAATAWGILIAAYARTPAQANAVGTALALVFGAAAGNFLPRQAMPDWLQSLSRVSPNAWGLEAFESLAKGGTMFDIVLPFVALIVMAVVLFAVSVLAFRRQYG